MNQFQGHSLKPLDYKFTQGPFGESVHTLAKFAEKMIVKKKPRKLKSTTNGIDGLATFTANDFSKATGFPIPPSNLIYNLNNDLAFAYSLCNICDKGKDHKAWLCYQLKSQVLYLDTEDDRRFEVSKVNPEHQNIFGDYCTFKVAEVREPWKFPAEAMENESIPLAPQHVQDVEKEVEWSDIRWGDSSIAVKSFDIERVLSYKFYPNRVIQKPEVPDVISCD